MPAYKERDNQGKKMHIRTGVGEQSLPFHIRTQLTSWHHPASVDTSRHSQHLGGAMQCPSPDPVSTFSHRPPLHPWLITACFTVAFFTPPRPSPAITASPPCTPAQSHRTTAQAITNTQTGTHAKLNLTIHSGEAHFGSRPYRQV